jgi:hypothetical protein
MKRSQQETRNSAEKRQRGDSEITEVILFPDAYTGLLLGTKGSTLNSIKEKCAGYIHVTPSGDVVNGNQRKVTLAGTQEEIDEAKQELDKFVKDHNLHFRGFEVTKEHNDINSSQESSEDFITVSTNFSSLDNEDNDDPMPSRSNACDKGEPSKGR